MIWINFLHLYQPVNTDPYVIEEATESSYKRLAKLLEANPNLKFSLNITGSLILRWQELGYTDLIARFKSLLDKGQIELTGSAAYHCLAPLVPWEEFRKQIRENTKILEEAFGNDLELSGFFLPEMAYSAEVAGLIQEEGFSWLILDEIAYNLNLGQADTSLVYQDKNSGLKVVLRSREFSNTYVPELILKKLTSKKSSQSDYLVTATDGELYGLRHNDPGQVLEKVVKNPSLKTRFVSEFVQVARSGGEVAFQPCNWESSEDELQAGQPYHSWHNPDNTIQNMTWELARFVYATIESHTTDPNYHWARWHLVRGFGSCTFWWASARDFGYIYGPFAWSPDEVERGLNELVRAVRSLEDPSTRSAKLQAEAKYIKIKETLWHKHWESYWKANLE